MIVAFSISPTAADETGGVSEAVAAAVRVVRESGLPNETNAMFTNIEGDWDEVMAVVKQAVDVVAAVSPAGRARAQGRHPPRVRRPADRQGRAHRTGAGRRLMAEPYPPPTRHRPAARPAPATAAAGTGSRW